MTDTEKQGKRNLTVGVGNHPYVYELYWRKQMVQIMPAWGVGPPIQNLDATVRAAIRSLGKDGCWFDKIVDKVCEMTGYKRLEAVETIDCGSVWMQEDSPE